MDQLLFSVREAAGILGIAEPTLYHLAKEGTITSVRLRRGRGDVRFRRADLERYVESLAPIAPLQLAPRVPHRVPHGSTDSGSVGQHRGLPAVEPVVLERA